MNRAGERALFEQSGHACKLHDQSHCRDCLTWAVEHGTCPNKAA